MTASAEDERRRALSRAHAEVILQSVELTHLLETVLSSATTTNSDVRLLLAVHQAPGATPSALARRLDLSRSAVSRALRHLQADDLVTRTADPDDRRVRRVSLTARGIERIAAFEERVAHHLRATSGAVLQACAAAGGAVPRHGRQRVAALDAIGRLAEVGDAVAVDATAAAARFGISSRAGRFGLSLVAEHGGLRPTDLAAALRLTSGGVSQLIDRLEAEQLVHRDLGVRDRRAVVVTLTERGERAFEHILAAFEPHVAAICSAFELASRATTSPAAAA